MILKRVIPFAHSLIEEATSVGDITVDGTVGNGNDTLMLANIVGTSGKVFGFDIQAQAIRNTKDLLYDNQVQDRVTLFEQSHDKIKACIPKKDHEHITSAIFNLGYLPGSDKSITTKGESTVSAIHQLLEIMKRNGLIVLVVYHGHPGGKTERNQLLDFVKKLDQKRAHVIKYEFLNQVNSPPFIIAIQKR